jgi:TRAP transporter 4TM/12TM fusion protein
MNRTWKDYAVLFFSLLLAFFSFYTGGLGALVPPTQRGIHVLLIFPVVLFMRDSKIFSGVMEDAFNILLTVLSCVAFGYYVLNWERLYSEPSLSAVDMTMGVIGILIVLEVTRRTVGLGITGIIIAFILYAIFGRQVPHDFIAHRGFTPEQVVYLVFYGTEGIFSVPVGVCATFIVMIVIFGGFLNTCGGADFFMNVAKSIAGPARGGPAKIAVIASGLMGMITGATVANVATTGSVTIPMMKKMGYRGEYAGAVTALASSGSQLMPPIMGAAVFIMVEFVMTPYIKVCYHAIAPALLYFLSIFMIVHFHSIKLKMYGIPRSECPHFLAELKHGGHLLVPIAVLVFLLSRWMDPMFAVFLTIVSLVIVSWFRGHTRIEHKRALEGIRRGVAAMAPITAICAAAGVIIGIMSMTGLGMRIAFLIEMLSYGHILPALILTAIACIILGMGLPTVAAYVVLAVIVPPALRKMGVEPLQAHLFIFYFAILSAITPPVCTGAYTAAGIANSNPIKTGIQSIKLGFVAFLLPFVFVYDSGILLLSSPVHSALAIFFTATGIISWAGAVEGYFFTGPISKWERVLYGIFAVLQITPGIVSRMIGLVGVLALIAVTSKIRFGTLIPIKESET